ncbi:COG3650 family protein [Phenylobacterium sp. VNQ135]|uniref:COG3650 family protein n=1 Tax=Phenylobacterium sp. VNQ135 TaxID=3400922 RepID=UPI003BFAFA3A
MRHLLPLAVLFLAACQPQAPGGEAAPPPADAPAAAPAPTTTDFSQDMLAIGTEPFWSLTMRGTEFELLRPDHPNVKLKAPGAQIGPGQGVWKATAEDGSAMTVTLRVGDCSDGMSDRTYPMSAEVEFAGTTLHGCAAKASDVGEALKGALGGNLGDLSIDLGG